MVRHVLRWRIGASGTYRAAGDVVVAALARDLEGDIVGRVALDLESAGREVVEILVEELGSALSAKGGRRLNRELPRNAAPPARNGASMELGIARTSFADLAISEKAGTDILTVRQRTRLGG